MTRPKGWTPDTLYTLGDRLPYDHPAKKDQNPYFASIGYAMTPSNGKHVKAKWTGEKRCPKKGEWYLSGCEGFVRAYKAPSDLSSEYFIGKIVLVENKTTTTSTILTEY